MAKALMSGWKFYVRHHRSSTYDAYINFMNVITDFEHVLEVNN